MIWRMPRSPFTRLLGDRILELMARDPSKAWLDVELERELKVRASKLHPALAKLENNGLILSEWLETDEGPHHRFTVTAVGVAIGSIPIPE